MYAVFSWLSSDVKIQLLAWCMIFRKQKQLQQGTNACPTPDQTKLTLLPVMKPCCLLSWGETVHSCWWCQTKEGAVLPT